MRILNVICEVTSPSLTGMPLLYSPKGTPQKQAKKRLHSVGPPQLREHATGASHLFCPLDAGHLQAELVCSHYLVGERQVIDGTRAHQPSNHLPLHSALASQCVVCAELRMDIGPNGVFGGGGGGWK
jgi:hypothetical protein